MNLRNYDNMDPLLLLGLVNTGLRNDAENLDDLVKTHGLNRVLLERRLEDVGYFYDQDQNQFRAKPTQS